MRHLVVNQNTVNIENTGNSLIEYVYNLVKNKTFDRDELSGNISVQHAYADAMDYLMERYRNLHITATRGEYIRFIDPVVENYYINEHGDGVGLTLQQAQSVSIIPSFTNNTELTNFNDLKYFTSAKSILANSFKGTTSLTDIDLINVQDIGTNAFQDSGIIRLNNHQYIKGPIGGYCFWNAYNISGDLDFRNAISWITCDSYTFRNTNISSIKLPTSITEIKSYAFAGCRNLKYITGTNNVTKIWGYTFDGAALEGIIEFPKCTTVEANAFITSVEYCNAPGNDDTNPMHDQQGNKFKITKLVFPELTACGDNAFRVGSYLTEIDMPKLKTIGHSGNGAVFSGTGLVNVSLPACEDIKAHTFEECPNLKTVSIPNCQFIRYGAFQNCTSLETIDISEATWIENNAFQNCTSLVSIGTFKEGFKITNSYIFKGCTSLETIDLSGISEITGGDIFANCTNLKTVSTTNSLTKISGTGVFGGCSKLETIDLSNVRELGGYTFQNCTSLRSINISNVTSWTGQSTFLNCRGLTSITGLRGNLNKNEIFAGCIGLTTLDFTNVTSVTGTKVFANCTGLETITNTSNLESLGEEIFSGCSSLTSIDISNCENFGPMCFANCSSLTSITNSQSLTLLSVPHRLFYNDTNLTFPNNTVTIDCPYLGYGAFVNVNSGLKTVILGSSVKKFYNNVFDGCTNLTEVRGLENVNYISPAIFGGCQKLTGTIDLSGVIGFAEGIRVYNNEQGGNMNYAFYMCKKITKIILGTIPYINHHEFDGNATPFRGCEMLHTVDITSINTIEFGHNQMFSGCTNMQYLIFRCTTVPTMNLCGHYDENGYHIDGHSIFGWSRIMSNSNGKIYVPDSALNDYKTAHNWSLIADHIFPLSEYVPIVD